jgi:oligopeptide transport system ATP-binding protein
MSAIDTLTPHIPLLEVKDLHVSFKITAGKVEAVNGVSFSVDRGKILGIVGESGSGKSVTVYSVMQIIDSNGRIDKGSIKLDGREMIGMTEKELREIRGNRIAMIFQDPMTALNPVYTIGNQLIEAIRTHDKKMPKDAAYQKSIEMLKLVGFNEPEKRMKQYPFEFSGGMLQRAVIAMALVCDPDLLIADEPTTALDVTIQAQILELLKEIQQKMGMAIIIITHDLGVVAAICDEVDVMYAGRVVERGTADRIFYEPAHEYTKGLINSVPTLADDRDLEPIKGNPVDLMCLPKGCPFAPRCNKTMEVCIDEYPPQMKISDDHYASCWMTVKKMQDAGLIDVTLPPEAPNKPADVKGFTKVDIQVIKESKPVESVSAVPAEQPKEAPLPQAPEAKEEEKSAFSSFDAGADSPLRPLGEKDWLKEAKKTPSPVSDPTSPIVSVEAPMEKPEDLEPAKKAPRDRVVEEIHDDEEAEPAEPLKPVKKKAKKKGGKR